MEGQVEARRGQSLVCLERLIIDGFMHKAVRGKKISRSGEGSLPWASVNPHLPPLGCSPAHHLRSMAFLVCGNNLLTRELPVGWTLPHGIAWSFGIETANRTSRMPSSLRIQHHRSRHEVRYRNTDISVPAVAVLYC